MPNISDQIADAYTARGIDLLRFEAGERQRILAILRGLEMDLVDKLHGIDPTEPARNVYRQKRLKKLLSEVKVTIASAYRDADETLAAGLRGLAEVESVWAATTVNNLIGINMLDAALTTEQLKAIAGDTLIQGAKSADWWKRQGSGLTNKFSDQIRLGMLSGESVGDMVRRVRGKATGRRHKYTDPITGKEFWYVEFKGGIMDTGTRQAQALVRTSVQSVAAEARREMFKGNEDVIKGIQQISTLDDRTSQICIAYSGASWDIDLKPINGTTLPYAGGVPRHWNCRSAENPILKTWREIGIDMDEMPPGTRASMDGQVAADMTFDEWLSGKSEEVQDKMLGIGKARLWREGKITLTDLVDQSGRPLSLAELIARSGGSVAPVVAKKAAQKAVQKALNKAAAISGAEALKQAEKILAGTASAKEKRTALHELLKSSSPGTAEALFDKLDKPRKTAATEGLAFFNNLVGAGWVDGKSVTFGRPSRGSVRSYYDLNGRVALTKSSDVAAVVHELGHWLEDKNPAAFRAAVEFLAERTKGEGLESLRKLTGLGFRPEEKTRKDKFIDPYMGKNYSKLDGTVYATEILSMGLELLFRDPGKMVEKDPGMFEWLWNLLRKTK